MENKTLISIKINDSDKRKIIETELVKINSETVLVKIPKTGNIIKRKKTRDLV